MDPINYRTRTPSFGPGPQLSPRQPSQHFGPRLLNGCVLEAERANIISTELEGLRNALPETYRGHLTAIIEEMHHTSRLLRDLADQSQLHLSQVPVVGDYLNIVLPCLCKTLRDINSFYEDKSLTKERRWKKMYHVLSNELPGTTMVARFIMYNQFLQLLQYLLIRSPNFDLNAIESVRIRILQLREARQIPPPSPVRTEIVRRDAALDFWSQATNSHWAETIFTQPLPSRREFKRQGRSSAFGPLHQLGHLQQIPRDIKILVKRSFDNDGVSVVFFLRLDNKAPYMLLRMNSGPQTWVSSLGVHELCIKRDSSSVLALARWSKSEQRAKVWASLSFLTWEEMVLFYCTFVCLKARSMLTLDVNPEEFALRKEKRLFQAQIQDDGYHHCLTVYEDQVTRGRRLHAAVWDGELRKCPVWTAFVLPDSSASWIGIKTKHKVWLRNIQIYTFCETYRPQVQRKGRQGEFFELEFAKPDAAKHFKEIFLVTDSTSLAGPENVSETNAITD